MEKTHHLHISFLLVGLFVFLASCEKYQFDNENKPADVQNASVRVITRAAEMSSLSYPIHVYAFSQTGALLTRQELMSADDAPLMLSLPQSVQCRIVAISADESVYDFPDNPTLSSVIKMKKPTNYTDLSEQGQSILQGFSTSSPLQMGTADVIVTGNSANVSIQLNYLVASLNVSLSNLPQECKSAYIYVASSQTGVTLGGDFSGTQTSRIPLDTQTWSTGDVYLFPTSGSQTTFTIAYNDEEGEQYASVCYMSTLNAGKPYILNGTCTGGSMVVTGDITAPEWGSPVRLDFTFTPGGTTTLDADGEKPGDNPETEDAYSVASIPQSPSLWEGHLVASVTPEGNDRAVLLLMSLADEGSLTSALNTTNPTTAFIHAQNYTEYTLSSWRIPTEAEASALREVYINNPDKMENLIIESQASPIVLTDEKGNNLRYLCEDAQKTFSFKPGSAYNSIRNAGESVNTYRLRLVKTVRVKVN